MSRDELIEGIIMLLIIIGFWPVAFLGWFPDFYKYAYYGISGALVILICYSHLHPPPGPRPRRPQVQPPDARPPGGGPIRRPPDAVYATRRLRREITVGALPGLSFAEGPEFTVGALLAAPLREGTGHPPSLKLRRTKARWAAAIDSNRRAGVDWRGE